MIEKILSGDQTGAEQAALDVAVKLDIPYGGKIPQSRKTEDGVLTKKYNLRELTNTSDPARAEKTVVDADGTLIFSHGALSSRLVLTQKAAHQHNRPCLHVNLNKTYAFGAATTISTWVEDNAISVLHVTGSMASEDAKIYAAVKGILESIYYFGLSKGHHPETLRNLFSNSERDNETSTKPQTANEAVEDLIFKLPLKDKTTIANMTENELPTLHLALGNYIMKNYELLHEKNDLISDSRGLLEQDLIKDDNSSAIIIKQLWKRLRNTHRLRVVK